MTTRQAGLTLAICMFTIGIVAGCAPAARVADVLADCLNADNRQLGDGKICGNEPQSKPGKALVAAGARAQVISQSPVLLGAFKVGVATLATAAGIPPGAPAAVLATARGVIADRIEAGEQFSADVMRSFSDTGGVTEDESAALVEFDPDNP